MIRITLLNRTDAENEFSTFVVAAKTFPEISIFRERAILIKGMPDLLAIHSNNVKKGNWFEVTVPTKTVEIVVSNLRKAFERDTFEIIDKFNNKEWTYEIL